MIIATINMTLPEKEFDQGLIILKSLALQSKVHDGCLSSQIYCNSQDENSLMFQQIWNDEESLTNHLCSDEYQQVLLVLEMATKKPEIRFDTVSTSTGIETIQKARDRKGQF
jgi:quinol monooxygenase YgiN